MAGRHAKPRTSRVPFAAAAALTALTAVLSVTALTGAPRGAERPSTAPAALAPPVLHAGGLTALERSAPPRTHTTLTVRLASARRVWVGHRRNRAMRWALHQAGKPYGWGGAGPSSFDCSGLVMAAWATQGVRLPHRTYDMLSPGLLIPVRHPKYGYLAFYGSGHVELYVRPGVTFGAHHSGTVISETHYSGYYHPTMFFRPR